MNIDKIRNHLYNELMQAKTRNQLLSHIQSYFLKYQDAFTVTVTELEQFINEAMELYPFKKDELFSNRYNRAKTIIEQALLPGILLREVNAVSKK